MATREAIDNTPNRDAIRKLNEKIKGLHFAMLTTVDDDGTLRSRPMATLDVEFDGTLWLFTYADSAKVEDISRRHQVSLAYARPGDNDWVSISGTARLVRDASIMQHLWKPTLSAWFPKGLHDPNLALLEVSVTKAEYWDGPNSNVLTFVKMARKALTHDDTPLGEHEKLSFH
jgi:general stress protein 26